MGIQNALLLITSYLLGNICTGYYLVRMRKKIDIREYGSGGVGARNVGRILGKTGFIITLIGDSAKGIIVVLLARLSAQSDSIIVFATIAVIIGHIWPIILRFRGGRGIATAVGAYLAYDYRLTLILTGVTFLLIVLRLRFIASGLIAFSLLPIIAYALKQPTHTVLMLFTNSLLILFTHREHIQSIFCKKRITKET